MTSPEPRYGQPRATAQGRGARRDVSHAVAERERGRRRLNATTATVGFASVIAAGAVAAVLPGSTHAAVTSTGTSSSHSKANLGSGSATGSGSGSGSSGSSGSGSGNGSSSSSGSSDSSGTSSSSNSPSSPGTLQAPANTPVQTGGGGQVTSGGTW